MVGAVLVTATSQLPKKEHLGFLVLHQVWWRLPLWQCHTLTELRATRAPSIEVCIARWSTFGSLDLELHSPTLHRAGAVQEKPKCHHGNLVWSCFVMEQFGAKAPLSTSWKHFASSFRMFLLQILWVSSGRALLLAFVRPQKKKKTGFVAYFKSENENPLHSSSKEKLSFLKIPSNCH